MAPDLRDVQFPSAVTEMLPFSLVNDDIQLKGLVGLIFLQSHKPTQTLNATYRIGGPQHVSVCVGWWWWDQPRGGESLTYSQDTCFQTG